MERKEAKSGWDRREAARVRDEFKIFSGSQRDFAKESGIPRTTLQHWGKRCKEINLDPAVVEFFESGVGQEFLHRMIVALLFDLDLKGNAGLRNLNSFLCHTHLNYFMASSKSSLQRSAVEMEAHTISFGEAEQERMAAKMPFKEISIAQDETFPNGVCLVAIELASNFILLERMADDRKTETWNHHMKRALEDLPVKVIQAVGDEARSLVKHATKGLGAHHSPDTFHIQQELTKAASAQLKLKVKRTEEALEKKTREVGKQVKKKSNYEDLVVKPRGRPPAFDARIEKARSDEIECVQELREAQATNKAFHESRRDISKAYHPYSLETGLPQSPEEVEMKLERDFDQVTKTTASLKDVFRKRVKKAHKQVGAMKATIAFFFGMVTVYLDNLKLDDWNRMLLEDFLIPACYLKIAASNIKDKSQRSEVEQTYKDLMSDYDRRSGPFAGLNDELRQTMLEAAKECAGIFQRSSSAVEGRNGQLALKYHNLHRLSDRKLASLTVIHNFDTRRNDGTTPAERFFDSSHPDLFDYLMSNMKSLGRPRVRPKLAKSA